ncbi:VCBS repeat domain-containing M23 family metallopeptidase [Nocardioides sp. SYSU D00038]|uniref:VCBS repeat domain-containing M23 family metallopeptidase n=1 Tax=Nocardioides sp. SYSU D00038 TaxID=2812554 RepID=UPI001967E415|nr:VCBS repeat domain-containing M23 family metallopeptidase [Nocardioides sp. SYSU D00038]
MTRRSPRANRSTIVRASVAAALVAVTLGALAAPGAAWDGERGPARPMRALAPTAPPVTPTEMPFPCGQSWTGRTRGNHSPSQRAIDFNRTDDDGDPVVAAAAGTVTTAVKKVGSGYGKYVVVQHSSTESTLYAHLSKVSVAAGQRVDQGAQLGNVGSTGNSSGPHLHFETVRGRSVIDSWFHGVRFTMPRTQASQNCVDVPLAGQYVGSRAAEVAVFRRSAASTFRFLVPGQSPKVVTFGGPTDQPVLGDWDGDGRVNPGVRTPATKTFRLKKGSSVTSIVLGTAPDLPIAGNWDGDRKWEVGIRQAGTSYFRLRLASGAISTVVLGDGNDLPVTGDWDGDGRTDLGVYDQASATFTLRRVDADGLAWTASVRFGKPGDLPVAGDWDGNGRTDLGSWTPATATFTQRRAASPMAARATTTTVRFGKRR